MSTVRSRVHSFTLPQVRLVRESAGAPPRARILAIRAGHGNLADRNLYGKELLQQSVSDGLFEGAQSFLDHGSAASESDGRSVRDLAGQLSNIATGPYTDPELGPTIGVFADFTPAATPAGEVAFGLIKSAVSQREAGVSNPLLGFSINAYGVGSPGEVNGEIWNIVERFTEVLSVDVVTRAGAGGGVVGLLEAARRREASSGRLFDPTIDDSIAVREMTSRTHLFTPRFFD